MRSFISSFLVLLLLCAGVSSCQAVSKRKLKKMQAHQEKLLASDEYKELLPQVQRECDSLFVCFRIQTLEDQIARAEEIGEAETEKQQIIAEARRLLYEEHDAQAAIKVFPPLMGGSQWYQRKKKEVFARYGITWYTRQELNPGVIYD